MSFINNCCWWKSFWQNKIITAMQRICLFNSKNVALFYLGILIFFTFIHLFVWYYFFNQKLQDDDSHLPLILAYTSYHGGPFFLSPTIKALETCPYKCRYSEDKKLYPTANIAIFHARNIEMDDLLYSNINYERLNVFYSMETFPHEYINHKNITPNFFNITVTFRKDSTIWNPYDYFDPILPNERNDSNLIWTDEQVDAAISEKKKLALKFVSHCCTHSRREVYLEAMMEYANISIYGRCPKIYSNAPVSDLKSHFFYFAFENSVCKDYITEKFWRMKEFLIVPVVMKRSILKGLVEDEYFIAADDFNSPKELTEKLIYLSKNLTEYKKYFGWTKKYKKTYNPDVRKICELCQMAVEKRKNEIQNIQNWWENQTQCEENYGSNLIKKEIFYFCFE